MTDSTDAPHADAAPTSGAPSADAHPPTAAGETPAGAVTEPLPYAGFVTRTIALAADAVIVNVGLAIVATIIGLALSVVLPGNEQIGIAGLLAAAWVWLVTYGIYLVSFWTIAGQTPGMRTMRLRVVRLDGVSRPGWRQSIRRLIGMVLAAIPLCAGFLLVLVDNRRQGFHDKFARTFVLYIAEEERVAPRALRDMRRPA